MKRSTLLCLMFMLCLVTQAMAVSKTFTGPGNFDDATKWSGGTLPVAGDDLTINGTCTVTNNVSTDNIAFGNLIIGGSAAGTVNWVASGTNRLNVVNVSSSIAASSLNMTNGGTLILRGTWTSTNLGFTPGTGTVDVRGTMTLPAAYTTYNGLIINSPFNTVTAGASISAATFTMTAGTLDLATFTLSTTGTSSFTYGTINNGTVTATGTTITFNGTTFGAIVNATSNALYLNGGTFNTTTTITKNGTSDITCYGGAIFNGTTTIANSGSGYYVLANNVADIFNGNVTFSSTGGNMLYPAFNSPGNQVNGNATFNVSGVTSGIQFSFGPLTTTAFNGNIIVNSTATGAGGIYFGGAGGTTTLASTKTVSIGGSGFATGTLLFAFFTQAGATAQSLTLTGTAMLDIGPSATFNGNVAFSSPQLRLNGGTYYGTAALTKTGAGDNASNGGNVFHSTTTITKSGSGYLALANVSPDIFNGTTTINNISDNHIWLAHNCAGNQFNGDVTFNNSSNSYIVSHFSASASVAYNGNIVVNNTSPATLGGISFGGISGCSGSLAAGKTLSVGTGFTNGNLLIAYFTQTGSTAQALTLSGTALLQAGPSVTFNGNATFIAPQVVLNGCAFNGTAHIQKNGATQNNSLGGNVFNGTTTIVNNGSGHLVLGYPTGVDVFNGNLTLTNTGTAGLFPAYNSAGHQFNGNIVLNNTSSVSIHFCAGTGTATLATGKTLSIGGTGFSNGGLVLSKLTQTGSTAQALALTGTAYLHLGPTSVFNGNVNFTAPQLFLHGGTYNGTATLTKNGAGDNTSDGNNIFNGATVITNSGTGFLRLANTTADDFNGSATFVQTGSGLLQPAYATNCTFAGNLSTTGTATPISFGTSTGTVTLNGNSTQTITGSSTLTFRNLSLNNAAGAVLQQAITVSNVLTLTNGPLDLNTRMLTLSNPATTAISRTNGYLVSEQTNNSSKVAWTIGTTTGAHTIPFGALGDMIPLTVDLTAGDIGTVTVSTYTTTNDNLPYPSAPTVVSNVADDMGVNNSVNVVDRFWQIDKTGPSGTATLTFTAAGSEVGLLEGVVAQRWNSTAVAWDAPIPGQNNVLNGVIVPGVTLTGPWALVALDAPLPVELLNFEAFQQETEVQVKWTTASEINSDFFEVERSVDGVDFAPLTRVAAAGRSTGLLHYSAVDAHPLPGVSYYRLRQVDLDGAATLSSQVEVNYASAAKPYLVCVPNPTTSDNIHLRIHRAKGQEMVVQLMDLRGAVILQETVQVTDDVLLYDFAPSTHLAPGMYIASAACGGEMYHVSIIVKQ